MLVLTRKMQETIQIGDNVTITVVRIKGNTVRVGIEAPKSVRVVRGEIAGISASDATAESAVAEVRETSNHLGATEEAEAGETTSCEMSRKLSHGDDIMLHVVCP